MVKNLIIFCLSGRSDSLSYEIDFAIPELSKIHCQQAGLVLSSLWQPQFDHLREGDFDSCLVVGLERLSRDDSFFERAELFLKFLRERIPKLLGTISDSIFEGIWPSSKPHSALAQADASLRLRKLLPLFDYLLVATDVDREIIADYSSAEIFPHPVNLSSKFHPQATAGRFPNNQKLGLIRLTAELTAITAASRWLDLRHAGSAGTREVFKPVKGYEDLATITEQESFSLMHTASTVVEQSTPIGLFMEYDWRSCQLALVRALSLGIPLVGPAPLMQRLSLHSPFTGLGLSMNLEVTSKEMILEFLRANSQPIYENYEKIRAEQHNIIGELISTHTQKVLTSRMFEQPP